MRLDKRTVVDRIEILASGIIQVRLATQIIQVNDDASEELVASALNRDVAEPGDSVKAKALLGDKSAIADLVWTPAVIEKYQAAKAVHQKNIKQVEANEELSQAG